MKTYLRYIIYLLVAVVTISSCKKEELESPSLGNPVKLALSGLILNDTLELVINNNVIATAFNEKFTLNKGDLFSPGQEVIIRTKKDGKQVGKLNIDPAPYNQSKFIYYDGKTVQDKIKLDPVSSPDNMGFRLRFTTDFEDFYGGPVDVEFFEQTIDFNTFEFTYRPFMTIKNVTANFSDYMELPELISTDIIFKSYKVKVYKAGTQELPYTKLDKVMISDPGNNYGDFYFEKGKSGLINITPYHYDSGEITDGYEISPLVLQ
jgi:hypothetical protein